MHLTWENIIKNITFCNIHTYRVHFETLETRYDRDTICTLINSYNNYDCKCFTITILIPSPDITYYIDETVISREPVQ